MKHSKIKLILSMIFIFNCFSCYTFIDYRKYNQKKTSTKMFSSWEMVSGNEQRFNYNPEEIKLPLQKAFFHKHESVLVEQPLVSNTLLTLSLANGTVLFLTYDTLKHIGEKRLAYGIDHSGACENESYYIPNALGKYAVKIFKMVEFRDSRSVGYQHTTSGILLHNNHLFYMENGNKAKLVNLENGKLAWEKMFEEKCKSQPVLANDTLYISFINGDVKAIDWFSGNVFWNSNIGCAITNNPIVFNNRVFVFSKTGIWAKFCSRTGKLLWEKKNMPGVVAAPAWDGNSLYVASTDHKIHAVNPTTMKILWSFETDGVLTGQPFITKSHVIIGSWDKKIYILNKSDGTKDFEETFKKSVKSGLVYLNGKLYINVANRGTYVYTHSETSE